MLFKFKKNNVPATMEKINCRQPVPEDDPYCEKRGKGKRFSLSAM